MIKFTCPNCGKGFKIADGHAGKKARCSKCGGVFVIPQTQQIANLLIPTRPTEPGEPEGPKLTFIDVPTEPAAPSEAPEEPDEAEPFSDYVGVPLLGSVRREPEPPPERTLPWPIDIFLFPLGIMPIFLVIMLAVLPNVVRILLIASGTFILIFFVFGFIIVLSLYVYAFWYFSSSVRHSAEGAIRAPHSVIDTPGVWEMFVEFFRAVIVLLFFFLPMMIYLGRTESFDGVFWLLFGLGVFLFPMGLLAITVLNSFTGLNPVFVVGSILSTLLPYCFIVVIYFGIGWLFTAIGHYWNDYREMFFISVAGIYYLMLVAGHLLGRFYFRYEKRLNWDA
jgi:predicted Zn finger-like uncharacterized protein